MEEYMVIEVIGEHTRCGGGREVERKKVKTVRAVRLKEWKARFPREGS
jgi:hypothetical protein